MAQGTIAYMSPEQTRAAPVDARADVWALGVVLYEVLTGRRPFRGDGPHEVIHAIRHEEPEPLGQHRADVPGSLARLVRRCLEKEPARRYASAAEVRRDLERLSSGRPMTGSTRRK